MEASVAPTKWAQVAAEKAAAAQQEAPIESKPSVADVENGGGGSSDSAVDDDGGGNGEDDLDDDKISSFVAAVPASQCEPPITEPQPTHGTAIESDHARGCHQCSARKTRAGAKLKLKKCSACMYARYCSEECQAADWREHKGACLAHCEAQQ